MHERCSAEVLLRRYGVPVGRMTPLDAVSLLEPDHGRSIVAYEGGDLVAAGLVAHEGDRTGLALHVEDDRQRRGIGSRLLRALAVEAADLGWEEVTCLGYPGDSAVLSTVRRAGLLALVSYVDGTCHYVLPLNRLRNGSKRREVDHLLVQPARG
jgi:GNAT superfamily N-acetyltransferase